MSPSDLQAQLKLAEYARLWVLAEAAKRDAKNAFSLAMCPLTYHGDELPAGIKEAPKLPPTIFHHYFERDEFGRRDYGEWVWNIWAPLVDPTLKPGDYCEDDPRFVAQHAAWEAYREARQNAGNRRRVLTRTVNRMEAQRAKAGQP